MTKAEVKKYFKENDIDLTDKVVCGVDVSSTKCGYCFLKNNEIIKYDHYEFDNDKPLYNRYLEFKENILPEIEDMEVDYIVLEDRLKSASNRTTAQTLFKLAYVNAVVQCMLKDDVGRDNVFTFHPSTTRSLALGSPWAKGDKDTKEWIMESIEEIYDMEFPINPRSTSTPKKRHPWCDDVADSIVLARSLFMV